MQRYESQEVNVIIFPEISLNGVAIHINGLLQEIGHGILLVDVPPTGTAYPSAVPPWLVPGCYPMRTTAATKVESCFISIAMRQIGITFAPATQCDIRHFTKTYWKCYMTTAS